MPHSTGSYRNTRNISQNCFPFFQGYQPLGTVSPALIKVKQSACKIWYKREKQILELQKRPWFESIGQTFGCPRNSIGRRGRSDSWFARTEVTSGLNGWEFDPCCGPANDVINPHCFGCQQNKGRLVTVSI